MFINIIQKHKINMNIIYNYIIVKNIQGFIYTEVIIQYWLPAR